MRRNSFKNQIKSNKRSTKVKFSFKPDTTFYIKKTTLNGKPFTISANVKPHLPSKPTIIIKEGAL